MVKKLIPSRSLPLVYLITDRKKLPRIGQQSEADALASFIDRALAAGVDMVQIREPDLTIREIYSIARNAALSARARGALLLINDRSDVAASVGAGVHLTTRSMTPDVVLRSFGNMTVGASTHSLKEALEAQNLGAGFVVFGPVFETASKKIYGPPVGLDALEEVASALSIPVLALGGINAGNFKQALGRGAAGIAAISLFAETDDIERVVRMIKTGDQT
jgi:thiamine-phosphate pyrophosphorylase